MTTTREELAEDYRRDVYEAFKSIAGEDLELFYDVLNNITMLYLKKRKKILVLPKGWGDATGRRMSGDRR